MYSQPFHNSITMEEYPQAYNLANYVGSVIKPDIVYDFGCSMGLYVREIKKVMPNIAVHGFEFAQDAVDSALSENVHLQDLTIPLTLPKTEKTLGICLEVLEHIDDLYWRVVLENLTRNTSCLIFSAALPGQGGTGHINCRPRIDWIRRFAELGWVVDLDSTQHLIKHMLHNGLYMGWFIANAMVLVPISAEQPPYYFNHYL